VNRDDHDRIDPELPGLSVALDPAAVSPLLAALLADGSDATRARVVGVELLKHRPGSRCALAYTVNWSDGSRRLFAKAFRDDRALRVLDIVSSFAAALDGDLDVWIPRPLGYLPGLRLMVTEYVEGRPIAPAVYGPRPGDAARRMARVARNLHECAVDLPRRWSPAKEIANTERCLAGLSGQRDADIGRAKELLRAVEAWSTELPEDHRRPIHRDFYPEQMIVAGDRTALLDLDTARLGDPAVDIGNCLAHLDLRALQFPDSTPGCPEAREVFRDAYLSAGNSAEIDLTTRIRFHEATSLLRLAGVYGSRPRWSTVLPPRLLDVCQAVLAHKERPC